MQAARYMKDNWIILTLVLWLATLTNHSRGEVVYRKLSTIQVLAGQPETPPLGPPAIESDLASGLRIVKLSPSDKGFIALLDGGSRQGLLEGAKLEVRRSKCQAPIPSKDESIWIPVAQLKVIEVRDVYALARLVTDGSQLSGVHFPDAPGAMVGDRAFREEQTLAQTIRVIPTRTLTYDQLFVDPKAFPSSFELTPEGKAYLKEQAQIFASVHAPLLLIEGHTDHHGDRQSNQIESYQRALTIRQTLIDELGLDPERLVAIGLGETEILDEPYLSGRDRLARRIVLRTKNQETSP